MEDLSLAKLDAVYQAIQAATTVQEVKNTLDVLAAAKVYAQQHKVGKEIQLNVAEYILRAERRLGEMLHAAKEVGQITHDHDEKRHPNHVVDGDDNVKTTLADAGISRDLSSRAQQIASIPADDFEKQIAEQKATGKSANLSAKKIARSTRKTKAPDQPLKPHYDAEKIMALHDKGLTQAQVAAACGIGERAVRHVIERERLSREGKQDGEIKLETLSMSAREKMRRWQAQERERMGRSFRAAVFQHAEDELDRRLEQTSKEWQAIRDRAERIMKGRDGLMNKAIFKLIASCLHPDWVTDAKQKARYEQAFREFMKLEKFVLDEKDSPTIYPPLPKTREEWDAMRRKTMRGQKPTMARTH